MTLPCPPFALTDRAGETRRFPTGRASLIAFIKEDCHTCNLAAPLLEAFHKAWGETADVLVLGQSTEGNDILQDRHGFTLPFLDDSACKTSFAWDFEIVPAVYAAVDQRLWPAAAHSALAHLIHLVRDGVVSCEGQPGPKSEFKLVA